MAEGLRSRRPSPPSGAEGAGPGPQAIAFPIVGIGASAGGLEALDEFLKHLPPNSGMAFVVVQHLDPNRPGMLVELLQRATLMKVVRATDKLKLRPDHVYVIPPNKDMSILRGTLFLFPPADPPGRRLPIDFFFKALAEDRREGAVGIIFSGMGSDGAQGVRAIRERGGLVLVESPASARFDSMPQSAIEEGVADRVAPPAALASEIVELVQKALGRSLVEPRLTDHDRSAFAKICILLRDRTGHDFSLYKKSTVYRRIERRIGIHGLGSLSAYLRHLAENPQEVKFLFQELLIGVTSFFRDPEAWRELREEVFPALFASRPGGGPLRAWVAACSTGEEAYTLAMTFREALHQAQPEGSYSLQIFATDLDPEAVGKARRGFFSARAVAELSPERLSAWFRAEGSGFRIRREIREMIVFAVQDVIQDPPFIHLDLLACRNLLIYLAPELQKRLMPLFHYSLNPGGHLLLGSAESIGNASDLFTPHPGKSRLFRRQAASFFPERALFPLHVPLLRESLRKSAMSTPSINLQALADQVLLQRFAPASVLASASGDILYVSGRTGKYLEPAMGKANWNVFAMAREGLRAELPLAFQKAVGGKGPVLLRGLKVETDGGTQIVDVTVQELESPDALQGMVMIVFSDQAAALASESRPRRKAASATESRVVDLELELKGRMEDLQILREEMQSSQEELKAANEELQSTNEELQSLNEELQTVNAEQQAKVDELSTTNNDMQNLLDATDVATLFLDEQLNVRRFTTGATRLFKLIPGDVGRPITDIVNDLDYPDLAGDALEVLRTRASCEKELRSRGGKTWHSVRILPYRTPQSASAGVVVSFTDISRAKALEAELRGQVKDQKKALPAPSK
ncbi:chemotaxis protein CheB [Geothrix sp. 21YS21S-4]|uniref:chemotaxis protein CheB n=1 Tax=Geothrix sp. 21YS21S-4 TaxID=3068889 RepID=UPI0027BAFC2A|nr:chemotaxis protein CheB [Geothrix sp. 21YS21S-4]